MKKTITFLTLLLLIACSKDNETTDNTGNPQIDTKKFINQAISQNGQQNGAFYFPDKYVYEGGKLIKVLLYNCSGTMYEFQYGSNGKISTFYHEANHNPSDLNSSIIGTADNRTTITYDTQNRVIEQLQVGKNLSTGEYSELKLKLTIDYNSDGTISTIQVEQEFNQLDTEFIVSYDERGNAIETSWATITYDDKVNPLYILYQEYGLFFIETCNSLQQARGYSISPNNKREIYDENNILKYSVDYTYDSDSYPTTANYVDNTGSIEFSEVDTFSYN